MVTSAYCGMVWACNLVAELTEAHASACMQHVDAAVEQAFIDAGAPGAQQLDYDAFLRLLLTSAEDASMPVNSLSIDDSSPAMAIHKFASLRLPASGSNNGESSESPGAPLVRSARAASSALPVAAHVFDVFNHVSSTASTLTRRCGSVVAPVGSPMASAAAAAVASGANSGALSAMSTPVGSFARRGNSIDSLPSHGAFSFSSGALRPSRRIGCASSRAARGGSGAISAALHPREDHIGGGSGGHGGGGARGDAQDDDAHDGKRNPGSLAQGVLPKAELSAIKLSTESSLSDVLGS